MQKSTSLRSHDDDVTAVIHSDGRRVRNCSSADIPPEDPPFSHGFLDRDPDSAKARSLYFKVIGGTLFFVFTYVIWAVFPIYWGSLYELYNHAHNLHGWVVVSSLVAYAFCFRSDSRGRLQDLDGGAIGQTVSKTFIDGSGPATKMTWTTAPSYLNLTTREQFENALVEEKVWAIIASA